MSSTLTNSSPQPLPLAEAQSRALKHSRANELWAAIEALEPIRQEWSREFQSSPRTACGLAYMAGLTAGKRLERARRNR